MKITLASIGLIISILGITKDFILDAIQHWKDMRKSWTPRDRTPQEEELTDFEKKHFK